MSLNENAPAEATDEGAKKEQRESPNSNSSITPRQSRALSALLRKPLTVVELRSIAGCNNGPALVAELRKRGLKIPCKEVPHIDMDGRSGWHGLYHLTTGDRTKAEQWLGGGCE